MAYVTSGYIIIIIIIVIEMSQDLTLRRLMSYIYIWNTHSWCF